MPARIITDRGAQFTSSTWETWCSQVGAQHSTTTAFHPQSNGMVERLHRQLKAALRARGAAAAWVDHLPWAMLGIRAAPKEESAISAGEAALGVQLSVPGQFQPPRPPEPVEASQGPPVEAGTIPATTRSYKEALHSTPLDSASWVYVRCGGQGRPLEDKYSGPYKVVDRGPKVFKLQLGEKVEVVTRDRLKPHLGQLDPEPAQAPRRGRPPRTEAASSGSSSVG